MQMQVGRGLKMVAKMAFDKKLAKMASPTRKAETYTIVDGKVDGVPVSVLTDKVLELGNSFQQTADKLYIIVRR
jgi:hypothetical protein